MPALGGWSAATGSYDLYSMMLMLLVSIWRKISGCILWYSSMMFFGYWVIISMSFAFLASYMSTVYTLASTY